MKKTVLYMHMGSGNHGCEALVRTTTKLIKDYTESSVTLWGSLVHEEYKYGTDKVLDEIVSTDIMKKTSPAFLCAYIKHKLTKKYEPLHTAFVKNLTKKSVAISIGGDNYCYPWSAKDGVETDKLIRKVCDKNVFWGCSIEEEYITDEVRKDLEGFDLITVREPLSYEILKKINPNTKKVADPAFLLDKKELPLPQGFLENNTVGINISPLIDNYASDNNIAFENYISLIKYILDETNMNVCLIPHVVWEFNNDFIPIDKLYEMFKDTGRVIKLADHNCEELKGYISRLRFFVGARTHATIAAYSTCVPTLVVGYSIKSKGIAIDLFGSYEDYVISVQSLKTNDDIKNAFVGVMNNEEKIKQRLKAVIPKYKEEAKKAGEYLSQLYK